MAAFAAATAIGITSIVADIPASAAKSNVNMSYTWNSSVNPYLKNKKSGTSKGVSGQYLKSGEQIVRFQPSTTNDYAFCIEPAKSMQGTSYGDWMQQSGFTKYDTFDMSEENRLNSESYWIKELKGNNGPYALYMGLVQYYGYSTHKDGNYFAATQLILWEMVLGYRGHTKTTFKNCSDKLWNDFTYPSNGWCTESGVEKAYNDIVNNVTQHYDLPSGVSKTPNRSKDNPFIMKYNSSSMRYEAKVIVPTSYVTEGSIAHNFSSLSSKLEKLTKDNFSGVYGTDYGVQSSVSGSNTIYTIWSKTRQFTSGTKTTEPIWLQTKGGISEQETLFAHNYYQTCLISTRIDPVSGYVSIASYNEPNLKVEKTYYNAAGVQITGLDLNNMLSQTTFVISTDISGTTYYVKAAYDSSSKLYVFSEYTTSISEATKFAAKYIENNAGKFTVNDLPTALTGGRTYKVSEYSVPAQFDKITKSVTLPSPAADDYATNAGVGIAKLSNKQFSTDYGDVTLDKILTDATSSLSTKAQSNAYKNTKIIAGYRDGNKIRYFTNAYAYAGQAFSGRFSDLGDTSSLEHYRTDSGQYYLPIKLDNNNNVVFNTDYTSTDISKAYVFTPGYQYDESSDTTCDYFGKVYLNFDTINVNNKKANSIFFIEISHADNYGYNTDDLTNKITQPISSLFLQNTSSASSGLVLNSSEVSIGGYKLAANTVYPYAIAAVSGTSRQAYGDIVNEALNYSLKIVKNDIDNNGLAGAEFSLYKGRLSADNIETAAPLETVVSDENGNVDFTTPLKPGTAYTYYEVSAPSGYVRDTETHTFNVSASSKGTSFVSSDLSDKEETVTNDYHELDLELHKQDAINDIPVKDISFEIYLNGKLIDTITTDENGIAAKNGLSLGKLNTDTNTFENVYTIKEVSDSDYKMVDSNGKIIDSFDIAVSGDNIVDDSTKTVAYTATVNNYLATVDLSIYKKDNLDDPIEGVKFDIRPTSDIIIKGNKLQAKGETVGSITTDKNGYASSTYTEYEDGSDQGYTKTITLYAGYEYELVETYTPDPYVKPVESTKFTAKKSNDTLVIPHSVTVTNEEKTGEVEVEKYTEGQKNISDIEFVLSGTSDTGRKISVKASTNESGKAVFSDIPVGTYTISENGNTVNTAYVKADDQSVTVEYGKTVTMKFTNKEKTGEVEVEKYTEGQKNIANIEFVLSGTSDTGRKISVKAVTDENGKAVFSDIPIGKYTISENGETVNTAYVKADDQSVTVEYNKTVTKKFTNKEKAGEVEVEKYTEGQKNISDIEFVLSGTSDTGRKISVKAVTDENGKAVFSDIPIGKYTISENGETVNTAYVKADDQSVTVEYGKTVTKKFTNKEKTGKIKIQKNTEGMTDISGIKFILKGTSDTERVIEKTAVTDENGEAEFSSVPIGTYEVYEDGSSVPYGYFTADAQSIKVEYNKTKDLTFLNEYQKGTITVYKTDNNDNTYYLAGAEFAVTATDDVTVDGTAYHSNDVIETIITDDNGKAVTTKLYPVGHTYKITETKSPDGYVLSDETKNVTLSFDDSVKYVNADVNFTNEYQQGSITVYKVDADDNQKMLAGAEFEVIANTDVVIAGKTVYHSGDVIETITTDKNGKAVTTAKLYVGYTYSLREKKAPDGYVLSDKIKNILLLFNANVKYVSVSETIENRETHLEVSKQDIYGSELAGAEMEIYNDNNELVDSWISDGTNHVVKGLKAGTYRLHEKAAPNGYVIATDIEFTLDEKNVVKVNGIEVSASDETGNPTIVMVDDTTKVKVRKLDENGNPIDGAKLEIYDESGKLIDSWSTEEYVFEAKLKAGMTYKLHEKEAPDGYVLSADVEFTVSLDGKLDTVDMIDKTTKVKFSKKSITGDDEVVGATLRVYDSDGNVIDEWVSTSEPHYVIAKYIAGARYRMEEIVAPAGYVKASDINFTVSDDGTVDVVTMYDDITKVEISKTDMTTGKLVEGAILEIRDKNDKVIDKWTTKVDEPHKLNGILTAGETYTLKEIYAPEGYVIANEVQFTVSSDGSIDKVEMQDERAVGSVKVTKHTEGQKFVKNIEFVITGTSTLGEKIRLTAKTDKDGVAIFDNVPIGTYTISENGETVANEIYIQAEEQTISVATDETTIVDFINLEKQGEITVTKTTEENKNIENIKFILKGISDSGRNIEREAVTDENGKAVFTKIPVGTYEIYEDGSTVPYAYLAADKQTAVVTYAGNTALEFYNEEKTGEINVFKHTEGNKNIENIKFILKGTSDSGRNIERTAVTDENGKAVFTNVPIGTYEIYEDGSTVPYAYLTADKQSVTVVYAESNDVNVENKEKKGSVTVTKHTEGNLNIEGIKFILSGTSDSGREIYSEVITDENGIATFDNIPIGSYVIKEEESSVNYAYLIADEQNVTVEYETNSDVEFYNSEKTGSIKVAKHTEGDLNVSGIGFTLSGTSDSGRYIEVPAITDENGIATFDDLPIGTYTIVENSSTVPYAYLVAEPQDVQVMYAETTNVDFLNEEKSGSIKVHKTTEGQLNVKGISFILSGTSDSGRDINEKAVTDENGIAIFNNIPIGTYTITEDGKTVPYGYLVADPIEVTVMYAETVDTTVLNKEQTGEVTVHKTTEGQRNISGITFILSGTSDTGREISIPAVTDKDGIARFENIPIGTYIITEDGKSVPYGYLVADPIEVTVMYAETVDTTILNKEQTGSIKLQKRTEGMTDISGIKFILKGTSDTGREIYIEAVTDKDGIATFENIPIGTYEIYEDGSTVPYGYLVADSQNVTVLNAETINVTFTNEKKPEEKQPEIPESNENTGAKVGGTLLSISICGALIVMCSRKRKKED